MELRGLKRRGEVLGAVLVLEGAGRTELQRASALGAMMADRCILVAVDGGLRTCRTARRKPDLLVGDGDSLKRPPRGFDRDHPLIEDLKRKDFIAVAKLKQKDVTSGDVPKAVTALCKAGAPLVAFADSHPEARNAARARLRCSRSRLNLGLPPVATPS